MSIESDRLHAHSFQAYAPPTRVNVPPSQIPIEMPATPVRNTGLSRIPYPKMRQIEEDEECCGTVEKCSCFACTLLSCACFVAMIKG